MGYHCVELSELWLEIFAVEADEGSFVAHLVAVVGRTEDGYAFAAMCLFVASLLHFMRTN